MCKLFYQMDIQIYEQISILRNCSKVKLCRAVSLGLGLKGVQIARNIAKFGMHACISNIANLWSNFNSGNLVKSETPSCSFAKVWPKEGKKALNITKFGMHFYLPNRHLNLWSYFNSKKLVRRETLLCAFSKVALKGSEIAWNITKVSLYAFLVKWVPKSTFKFHF